MKHIAKILSLGAVLLASASFANASMMNGQFSITGVSVVDNGTSLTFSPSTINVGAANTLTGSFSTLLTAGEAGTISSPIVFSPTYTANSANFNIGSGALVFTISSLTEITVSGFDLFTGTGTLTSNVAGYDPTAGTLSFSAQGTGPVTFSATSTAAPAPTPEPSTLLLLGTGLVGSAGALFRRMRSN